MLKDNEYNMHTNVINNINRQDNDSFCAKILIILLALKNSKTFPEYFVWLDQIDIHIVKTW